MEETSAMGLIQHKSVATPAIRNKARGFPLWHILVKKPINNGHAVDKSASKHFPLIHMVYWMEIWTPQTLKLISFFLVTAIHIICFYFICECNVKGAFICSVQLSLTSIFRYQSEILTWKHDKYDNLGLMYAFRLLRDIPCRILTFPLNVPL